MYIYIGLNPSRAVDVRHCRNFQRTIGAHLKDTFYIYVCMYICIYIYIYMYIFIYSSG